MGSANQTKRILIIEDEPFVAEVVKCALQDQHEIDWAADASGAVMQMTDEPPDLVIADCLIPGGRLTEVLGKAGVLGAPVVMMSGHPELLGQFGASGYPCLEKPFDLDVLLHTVDDALYGRWAELHAA